MFGKGDCYISYKMYMRLNNFLYIFNLRQGCIFIAIHQIAQSAFILIILLVCISHVGEMISMLHSDMEDDTERRGFYEVRYGNTVTFHEGDVVSTNNQRRFAIGQNLAQEVMIVLYTSTILTAFYLMSCISLLHGAVQYKREYVVPWICGGLVITVLMVAACIGTDNHPTIIKFFNGNTLYRCATALIVLSYTYAICCVSSFALEIGRRSCRAERNADSLGERLLLLDHSAHSSLLSAAQISKLSHGTRTQFV